jgi:Fe-S cluster assembly scaffold protein SufB
MKTDVKEINTLYRYTGIDPNLQDPGTAHLAVNANHILGMRTVPGLEVDVREIEDGIDARIILKKDVVVEKPVHLCFGMLPETGVQRILLDIEVGDRASVSLLAHCVFPTAVSVEHIMDARIKLGEGARYSYFEKHIHSPSGGVRVLPRAVVEVGPKASFTTEFELIRGRVGLIDIDYQTVCRAHGIVDMTARISGIEEDIIKIKESASLEGEYARGVLTTKVAVRDRARAEAYNTVKAYSAHARGHVDCKEIVQDEAIATAVPIVEVHHPKAHVTHEAAIGSVDGKQLETLMSRGLSEDSAVEAIINGLLGT